MAEALRAAERDAGGDLLSKAESIELIGLISWRYADPVNLLCEKLGIAPARRTNASMGGETPIPSDPRSRRADRAWRAERCLDRRRRGDERPQPRAERQGASELDASGLGGRERGLPGQPLRHEPTGQGAGMMDPAQVYPFYEVAAQAAWGQTPAEAQGESARLWSRYAAVAATNDGAWIKTAPEADTIGSPSADNRPINWPYPKFMVANPSVNQSGAVIVASLAAARAAGVPEDRIIHIWGGAAASEPEDYLLREPTITPPPRRRRWRRGRDRRRDARAFDRLELYSCFPVVPKWRCAPWDWTSRPPSDGGGRPDLLRRSAEQLHDPRGLRDDPAAAGGARGGGLLYGQGGYVNKHHALWSATVRCPGRWLWTIRYRTGPRRSAVPFPNCSRPMRDRRRSRPIRSPMPATASRCRAWSS